MNKLKSILRDDNGEVMLESTIIMTFTLFILIAMISVGFLYYQQAMLNNVATEIATEIGANYKYSNHEFGSADISLDDYRFSKVYRTSLAVTTIKSAHSNRSNAYLPERVRLTTLGILHNEPTVDKLEIINDNVGRLHVEVTVSMESSILFDGALKYFGIINSMPRFTASARAECLDITSYASNVTYLDYLGGKIKDGSLVDSILDTLDNITDIVEKFNK